MRGILTFLDPPRPDTREVLHKAMEYGIEVKMITGSGLHSFTIRLNVSTFCGMRWVHAFPQSTKQGNTGRCDQNGSG
jgi:hypothetical protein